MRRRRWLILLIVPLVLALGVYAGRETLIRVVIAERIRQMHVVTPPAPDPGESRWRRFWAGRRFYGDLADLYLAREKRARRLDPELKPLVQELQRHQAAGEAMQYSMHIYREIRWRLNFTPDLEATRARIADLRRSLEQPEEQKLAAEQQACDGSWGRGFTVWYLKLYYSVEDGLKDDSRDPRYPLSFLDRINDPEKLTAQFEADLHNDFTRTGVFNREELDETFSALARLLFGNKRTGYAFHPELAETLRAFVQRWQNPATGCWGQWLVDRHGRVWKMDDMAMTFHVISDLHGQVDHLDRIANRVLQLDGVNFPAGIRVNGHYENHLNWDVVKIFRYAWPTLDAAARERVRAEITRMLDWCLADSYQPDGSFKVSDLDDTLGDAYGYGVRFLRDVGYFRRENRFWTDRDFPDAKAVLGRIEARLKTIGLNDPGLKEAYETLRSLE